MQIRCHEQGATRSRAVYSDCGLYRYELSREWGAGARLAFVMLNPSTADERRNDPTVERCERRARAAGASGFKVLNLFAFRATRPEDLKRADAPVGPLNDAVLGAVGGWADQVICAWGAHGGHRNRAAEVEQLLRDLGVPLWHLGLTRHGHPRHPLYLPYTRQPELWAR